MVLREQGTQTERIRNRYRDSLKPILNYVVTCLASLILPLILGIFTVTITFHQEKIAREQRLEDLQLARQQRLEDEKETQLQRKHDWDIAMKNQEVVARAASERYRDEILVAYIKDIGDLLEKYNGSITSNTLAHTLARVKTRNALHQLDGSRQTYIIRFLYEVGELISSSKSRTLDMSQTELTDIDFRQIKSETIENMQLGQISLRDCTFSSLKLTSVDLWAATLDNVSFSSTQLEDIDFQSSSFKNVNFSSARLSNVRFPFAKNIFNVNFLAASLIDVKFNAAGLDNINFSSAKLGSVTFSHAELHNVSFSLARLSNVDFLGAKKLSNVTFSSASLSNVAFSSAFLENLNFSFAELYNTTFSPNNDYSNMALLFPWLHNASFSLAGLYNIIFSSAHGSSDIVHSFPWLHNVSFLSARLRNIDFSSMGLLNVNFSFARFFDVNFSSAKLLNVDFSFARLLNANFSSTKLINVDVSSRQLVGFINFHYAHAPHAVFVECDCDIVDFTGANLKSSSFRSATLNNTIFSLANLQNADFTNTTITDNQLQSALSIRNAKLPNGTFGQDRNLIKNGDANCKISLVRHWQVQNGHIAVVLSEEDRNQCQFSLQSVMTGAIMSQRITLVDIWDSSIWTNSNVELQADMSSEVSIELSGKSSNGAVLDKHIANSINNKIIMKLEEDMQELEVVVKFNGHNNKNNYNDIWCDNIELFIDYDKM